MVFLVLSAQNGNPTGSGRRGHTGLMQPLDSQMAGGLRSEQRFVSERPAEKTAQSALWKGSERQRKAAAVARTHRNSQTQAQFCALAICGPPT